MDQPKFTSHMRSISNDFFCHIEINYFMSPNMQIILLNERCLTSQIQLICKCKWGFICDILYGWEKTKRLLNSNTNCSDWLSHIIIHSESSKYQNSDKNAHTHMARCIYFSLFISLCCRRAVHHVLFWHLYKWYIRYFAYIFFYNCTLDNILKCVMIQATYSYFLWLPIIFKTIHWKGSTSTVVMPTLSVTYTEFMAFTCPIFISI